MPVRELERSREVAVVPEKKTEPPKKYQAVYRQDDNYICACNMGLLIRVFNVSAGDAKGHIESAISKGQTTLLIGSRDTIQTKVTQAIEEADRGCRKLRTVHFTCEPA